MSGTAVAKPDLRVLELLWQLAAHHGRVWCYPNQATILTLLRRFHARRMSRRTLNRHLHALVAGGYIERIRRHIKLPSGELALRSTVYTLLPRARRAIARAARACQQLVKGGVKWLTYLAVPQVAQHGSTSTNPSSPPGGERPPGRTLPPPAGASAFGREQSNAARELLRSPRAHTPTP